MKEIPLQQLADSMGADMNQTVRAVKIALFSGVIRDTRVDTGRLRGNWQTSTGAPRLSPVERTGEQAALIDVQTGVTADGVDYLTNNLPYAEVWEQADGMVSRNVARMDRNIREAIRER